MAAVRSGASGTDRAAAHGHLFTINETSRSGFPGFRVSGFPGNGVRGYRLDRGPGAENADASEPAFIITLIPAPLKSRASVSGTLAASPSSPTYVSTRVHTEPQAFGKVMSAVKPRLAVGYHSVQSPENNAAITDGVRKTYDGPLALARDLMVINVTKDIIKVRMASVDEYALPPSVTDAYQKAPRTDRVCRYAREKVPASAGSALVPESFMKSAG